MRPKFKGQRLLGGYYIPYAEAAAYKRRLKRCRKAALSAMRGFCPFAISQWADSQDGEAVCGLDSQGNLIALIHLDSDGLDLIEQGIRDGNLQALLEESAKE